MLSGIKGILNSNEVKVLDTVKDMYIGDGSTILFPKYVDFLSDAKLIHSVLEFIYYDKLKRYKVYIIDKRFNSR